MEKTTTQRRAETSRRLRGWSGSLIAERVTEDPETWTATARVTVYGVTTKTTGTGSTAADARYEAIDALAATGCLS